MRTVTSTYFTSRNKIANVRFVVLKYHQPSYANISRIKHWSTHQHHYDGDNEVIQFIHNADQAEIWSDLKADYGRESLT